MTIAEEILEHLKTLPESSQTEVLDFIEYLKSKEDRKSEENEWTQFSLESAMRGIKEEHSPYQVEDIKEKL